MGMTVVHAELEMKRLKKLEEIKSKYFSTRLSAMLFIQVIESQSAVTAFKLIQNNKCHVHSTAQQMARKQEEDRLREQANKQKKKAEKDKQMKLKSLLKKTKRAGVWTPDEIN